jgi:hypothetical protein
MMLAADRIAANVLTARPELRDALYRKYLGISEEWLLIGPAEAPLNRATSSRNAGRNHLGTPSEIKSE